MKTESDDSPTVYRIQSGWRAIWTANGVAMTTVKPTEEEARKAASKHEGKSRVRIIRLLDYADDVARRELRNAPELTQGPKERK